MSETKKHKDKFMSTADGCLGSLEHHVHSLFAADRVPGDDYVYHPSVDLFNALEDFCDEQTIHEPRQPLLVTGEHGTGKSALLANWLQRRQRAGPRGRGGDEFIFWHAVGSSRKSMEIHNLIRRLMRDLKRRFDIAREVPFNHAQLSWDLPRFLELASRKGKVIIVIDGIQRLTSQDGETGLSWLPLEFPPNVRVVVSAVSEATRNEETKRAGHHSEKTRIMGEIERREWTRLRVKPLDSVGSRSVIESYMRKAVQADVSRVAGQTAAMLSNLDEITGGGASSMAGIDETLPGFMLFDTQINMIVNHSLAANPLFLRTLLRCLYWGASHGYCLWTLLNTFLAVESTEELFSTVFATFEKGFASTAVLKEVAKEKTIAAGGVPALRVLYPWHPSFQPKEESAIEIQVADFQSADGKDTKGSTIGAGGSKSGGSRQPSTRDLHATAGSGPTPATLKNIKNASVNNDKLADEKIGQITSAVQQGAGGGMQWLSASEAAENELEYALINTQCALADLVESAEKLVPSYEGSSFIEVFLASQVAYSVPESASREPSSMNLMYSDTGFEMDEPTPPTESAGPEPSNGLSGTASGALSNTASANPSVNTSLVMGVNERLETLAEGGGSDAQIEGGSTVSKATAGDDGGSQQGSVDSPEGSYIFSSNSGVPRRTVAASHTQSFMKFEKGRQSGVQSSFAPDNRNGRPRLLTLENDNDVTDGVAAPVDPLEAYNTLPIYQRGGVGIFPGFGDLLGNSLSLLHAARHGLREMELWSMVSKLQSEGLTDGDDSSVNRVYTEDCISTQNSAELNRRETNSVGTTKINSEENKLLLSICAGYCEQFSEAWMVEDPFRRGTLTLRKLLVGMQRCNADFGMKDLRQLLTLINLSDPTIEGDMGLNSLGNSQELTVGSSAGQNAQWDYQQILARLVQSQRLQKLTEAKAHLGKKGKLRLKKKVKSQATTFEAVDQKLFSGSADGYNTNAMSSVSLPGSATTPSRHGPSTEDAGEEVQYSLGPVLEEGLLSVLCALGVLHSTEHHILVFPSEAQAMRGVVKFKYVQKRGGIYNWHNKLIRYFNAKENCLRRCEELPWHMTICRKWYALRDTLSDLSAFDLMFKGDLREELIRYWTLLTFGPLYVSDDAQQEETNARLHKTETQLILSDLDTAVVLNLNEKQTRKQRLRGKVAAFDVVEEYEKAVDLWVSVDHPNSKKMGILLEKIARFLVEFGKACESSPPPFLRMGLDADTLKEFSISHSNYGVTCVLGEGAAPVCTSGGGNIERMSGADVITEEAESKNTYYYYMRWIWIQYPWLAMQWLGQMQDTMLATGDSRGAVEAAGGLTQQGSAEHATAQDAVHASAPDSSQTAAHETPNALTSGAGGLSRGASSIADARRRETMQRTWTMRKNEALGRNLDMSKSLTQPSMTRMHSFINAGMTSQKNLDALESLAKQAKEVPERVTVKYRRSLEQHESFMSNIPHAQATTRSKRKNTMFPSVDAMFKEKKRVHEEEEINKLLSCAKPGDLESVASLLATNSLQVEIQQLQDQESLELINRARGGALPITNPSDIQMEAEAVRTAKLRSAYDKCRQMVRQKVFKLEEMVVSTEEKSSNDEQVAALFESAEIAKASLDERYEALSCALDDAKGLNTHFTKLIAFLNVRPPYNERHVASLEQELVLAKQQFDDLMKYRSTLYSETEHIEKVTGKKIKDRIKSIQQQRKVLRQKLRARRVAIARAQSGLVDISERIKTAKDTSSVSEVDTVLTIGMPAAPAKDWSIVGMNTAAIARAKIMASMEATEKEKEHQADSRPLTASDTKDSDDMLGTDTAAEAGNTGDLDGSVSVASIEPSKAAPERATGALNMDSSPKFAAAVRPVNRAEMRTQVIGAVPPSTVQRLSGKGASSGGDVPKARRTVEHVLLHTGCNSTQDFIERYAASVKLQESLKSQQSLSDSRIAQLKIEHAELVEAWNETNFVSAATPSEGVPHGTQAAAASNGVGIEKQGSADSAAPTRAGTPATARPPPAADGDNSGSAEDRGETDEDKDKQPSSSSAERQMRYLDNKLFKAEMRLNHNARQSEKAVLTINEIKTGVQHLVNLLAINEKLLSNLPSSTAPVIRLDDDIAKNLSWCEERVLAINESMLLDNSKTLGDYSKPLHARQIELANVIETQQIKNGQGAHSKRKRKKGGNRRASLSTAILSDYTDDNQQDNSIRVLAHDEVDDIFNQQVEEALQESDTRAEDYEAHELALKGAESQEQAMVRLLGSALSGRESVRELRRANILSNKKLGRNSGYGWAVDDLLRIQHADEIKKKKQRDRSNGVIDEGDEEECSEDELGLTRGGSNSPHKKRVTVEVGEDGLPIPQPVAVPHAKRLDKNKVLTRADIKSALAHASGPGGRDRKQRRDGQGDCEDDGEY